jgi:hypothetical protein
MITLMVACTKKLVRLQWFIGLVLRFYESIRFRAWVTLKVRIVKEKRTTEEVTKANFEICILNAKIVTKDRTFSAFLHVPASLTHP